MHTVLAEVIRLPAGRSSLPDTLARGMGAAFRRSFAAMEALRKELDEMMKADAPSVRGSWLAAFLGGLPFFLFALAQYILWLSRRLTVKWSDFSIPCIALPIIPLPTPGYSTVMLL